MRAFIAIELSEELRVTLYQLQSHLKYAAADVKWVRKDNIHLTLKFLGDIDEKKTEKIKLLMDEAAGKTRPFEISLKDTGAFPNIDHPSVIWVGLDKGAEESAALAEKLDEALSKIGFQKETRPFTAHLTLGRLRSPKNKDALKEKILSASSPELRIKTQPIRSISFFQSTLTPSGSVYSKLHEAKFEG